MATGYFQRAALHLNTCAETVDSSSFGPCRAAVPSVSVSFTVGLVIGVAPEIINAYGAVDWMTGACSCQRRQPD